MGKKQIGIFRNFIIGYVLGVIHFSVIRFVKAFVCWAFGVLRCQDFCGLTHD